LTAEYSLDKRVNQYLDLYNVLGEHAAACVHPLRARAQPGETKHAEERYSRQMTIQNTVRESPALDSRNSSLKDKEAALFPAPVLFFAERRTGRINDGRANVRD